MKVQSVLLILGILIAIAASKPAEDTGMARLLLRSCDHNADNALNAAEFAGCLVQTSRQQRSAALRMGVSRSELLQSFMDEADSDKDLRADEEELQKWSERWFLSGLFGGEASISIDFSEVIEKIIEILQYISEEKYAEAVTELYALVSGSDLSVSGQVSVNLAITAILDEKYGEALGYIYSVIREIAGGDDAGGIFVVSASTATNVASLLQAVIENNSENINFYIYRSLSSVIADFTILSEESANAVAALIQVVIEGNSDEFYSSLTSVVETIEGISAETATALTALLEIVVNEESDEIANAILAVLTAMFEDDGVAEIANTLVAVIEAVMDGNNEEAIKQLTLLLAMITEESSGPFVSAAVVAQIEIAIQDINDGDSDDAITVIQALLDGTNGGDNLSAAVKDELQLILTDLNNSDTAAALAKLLIISAGERSSSLSSASTAALLLAIQSVSSGSASSASASLRLLLEEDISSSFKEEINDILGYLDDENYARAISYMVTSMIGSGNSISESVAQSLYAALRLSISGDYGGAASEIEDILGSDDELDSDIWLALSYVAQLLREENSLGALTMINVIIEEAFGVDKCYCA